jgi:CDGSH-type Zn-finger protein
MTALTSNDRNPAQELAGRELNTIVEAAIDELAETDRVVFMLREVEALSTAETAECVGLSEDAVRVRLHRAQAQLRDNLFDRVGAAAPAIFQFADSRSDRVVTAVFDRIAAFITVKPEWSTTDFTLVTGQSPQTSRVRENVTRRQQGGLEKMAEVRIQTLKDGPYEVNGVVHLHDSKNAPFTLTEDPIYLCRCGHSANKPFCDGSHKRVGFRSEEPAR